MRLLTPPTLLMIQSLTNSEEKQKLDDGSDGSDEDHEQEDEAERKDHKNKGEGVTANTAKTISSGKEKSSREKNLTKSVSVDQQLIALNKEKIELKREMLRKMDHQEQQFNQTIKYYKNIRQDLQISFLVHYK